MGMANIKALIIFIISINEHGEDEKRLNWCLRHPRKVIYILEQRSSQIETANVSGGIYFIIDTMNI